MNAKKTKKIVLLATGGTIAGMAADAKQPQHYKAGVLPVGHLLAAVSQPFLSRHGVTLQAEQVAQIDSKDMSTNIWQDLTRRLLDWLNNEEVHAVVITHGSDTLEETAYFLQAVLTPQKPVVLTCAMRPANAADSDGSANLHDAVLVAAQPELRGVVTVCGGSVHPGHLVQKIQSHDLLPFVSVGGPVARVVNGKFLDLRPMPSMQALWDMPSPQEVLKARVWPRVELVVNHAGATGDNVRDMMNAKHPPAAWVVAGTGNGTLHHALQSALSDAQSRGARVVRTTRCALGHVTDLPDDAFMSAGQLTPVQSRVALQLALIKQAATTSAASKPSSS